MNAEIGNRGGTAWCEENEKQNEEKNRRTRR